MNDDVSSSQRIVFFQKPQTKTRSVCAKNCKKESKPVHFASTNNKKKDTLKQDIFEIHKKILGIFDKENDDLPQMKEQVERLHWIYAHTQNEHEQQLASEQLQNLKTTIELIESGMREAQYIFRTEGLLSEYEQILNKPIKIDFMGNRTHDPDNHKQTLFTSFINIARNYLNIKSPVTTCKKLQCSTCYLELRQLEDLLFVCPKCNYSVKNLASVASYQDNNRINVTQRYVYDKRAHFGDSIKKFQAKQNTTISDEVYSDLRDKISKHDLRTDQITKDHIYEFLRSTGHNGHYEDIILIYCELTGMSPPDISYLEEKLFSLFDQVEPIYERIKPADRVNFLNGQFVLFKLLQKLKYPCNEDDFYILKTRDKMIQHDQMWKQICAELKWTYIPTV